jgi:hypothetical protein
MFQDSSRGLRSSINISEAAASLKADDTEKRQRRGLADDANECFRNGRSGLLTRPL